MQEKPSQDKTPEYVKTNFIGTQKYFSIPTDDKINFRIRRAIVLEAYDILLKKNGGNIKVHNDFLEIDIEITRKINRKKASNNSVRHWQSTYAILKIITYLYRSLIVPLSKSYPPRCFLKSSFSPPLPLL